MIENVSSRRRRKKERPRELLLAALELFAENGFTATRIEDVATRANVSKGTLYLYFSSKEELFLTVVREGIEPVLAECESLIAKSHGDSATLLREVLLGLWTQVSSTPLAGVAKLIISEAGNFPNLAGHYYENVIKRGRYLLGCILKRGIASGEFRTLPVEATIDVMFAPLSVLTVWWLSPDPCCVKAMGCSSAHIEIHLDLLLNGLTNKDRSCEATI